MLHLKQILLLLTLLQWTNEMALDSVKKECIDKGNCMDMESSTAIINDVNSTESHEVVDQVYYSIIDTPVVCKGDERVDFRGICRKVF